MIWENLMLSICEIVRESGGWLQPNIEIHHTLKQVLAKDMPIAMKRENLKEAKAGRWHSQEPPVEWFIRCHTSITLIFFIQWMIFTSSWSELTINWIPKAPENPSRSARILGNRMEQQSVGDIRWRVGSSKYVKQVSSQNEIRQN